MVCVMTSRSQSVPRCEMQLPHVLSSRQAQVTLQMIVWYTKELSELNPPRLSDFEIVRGPIRETGSEKRDGLQLKYQVIRYLLKPLHDGVLHLNGFTAVADGKSVQSQEASLKVGNSVSAIPETPLVSEPDRDACMIAPGETLEKKISGKLVLKLEVSKQSVYVGEPILLQYKLYSQLMSESSVSKNSSLSGFSVMDLLPPGETPLTTELFNGRNCPVYLLRKAQVFPLQSGNLKVDALETNNTLRFLKEDWVRQQPEDRQSLQEAFLAERLPEAAVYQEQTRMKSNELSVLVKPLPDSGKPPSFAGAVGNLVLQSSLSKRNYYLGEPVEWVISISGNGNLPLLPPPAILWPSGIPQTEPVTRDTFDAQQIPLSGTREFHYTLLPDSAGNYTMPAVSFSYFNPSDAAYHELRSDPVPFTVLPAKMPGIELATTQVATSGSAWIFTHRWVLLIPLVLLVISGVIVVTRSSRKQPTDQAIEPETQRLQFNQFEQSTRALQEGDARAFYRVLEEELIQNLKAYAGIGAHWISRADLLNQVRQSGLSAAFLEELKSLLNHIDQQRYSPMANESNMAATYAQAKQLAQHLNA